MRAPLDLASALQHSATALGQCRDLLLALEAELLPASAFSGSTMQMIDQISQRMDGLSGWIWALSGLAPPGIGQDRVHDLLTQIPLGELRHQLAGIHPPPAGAPPIEVF